MIQALITFIKDYLISFNIRVDYVTPIEKISVSTFYATC